MQKTKGFTIIELLVVIAIIAVLAAIVLVNVTSYIAKAKNAAIKGNMATILTNAAVWYDSQNPSTYVGFDGAAQSTYQNPAAGVVSNGGTITKTVTISAACFCTTLNVTAAEPTGSTFCVDATGYKKVTLTACATRCPAGGGCVD